MSAFDLLEEPWIPCRMSSGSSEELGIAPALRRAHEVAELFDPSPLVTAALHRLLLALVQAAYGPANPGAWRAHWRRGSFDPAPLEQYFEQHRAGFDLFGPERPFFQVPPDADAKEHPAVLLAQERATGNNATLFDHTTRESARPLTAAEAARYLVALQSYALGGGVSKPFNLSDGPLARGFSVLVQGGSLFETLMLNLGAGLELLAGAAGQPAWEWTKPRVPDRGGTRPTGFADYMTWQSRRVLLVRDSADPRRVAGCRVQQNLSLPRDGTVLDPFKCYRLDKDRGAVPRAFSEHRALWRDSTALFQLSDDSWKRPEVFNWLARMTDDVADRYTLSAYGVATAPNKAASVVLWRHERLPLPLSYLRDQDLVAALGQELNRAEAVGHLLEPGSEAVKLPNGKTARFPRPAQILGETLAKTSERQPTPEVVRQVLDRLQLTRGYWSRLETPFRRLLVDLPGEREENQDGVVLFGRAKAGPAWHRAIREAALAAFREGTRGLERTASSRGWKAISQAEVSLYSRLGQILPHPAAQENAA